MHMDRMHAPLLPLLGSDNLAHQHLAWCQRRQRVQCRSEHILPVTGLCIGAGVSEPIVATVSLDRNCIIHSLASGRLQQSLRTMLQGHSFPGTLARWLLDQTAHLEPLGLHRPANRKQLHEGCKKACSIW